MTVTHTRPFALLVAVLAAAGIAVALVVGAGGAQGAASAQATGSSGILPTIYVNYTIACTFTIVNDQGAPVTQIPPGTYQVEVDTPELFKTINTSDEAPNDYTGCKGWVQFQLTGPGVSLATTLDVGCDDTTTLGPAFFAPNSSFVAVDNNNPSGTRTTFTTAATGTPPVPNGYGGSPVKTSTSTSGSTSPLGSATPPEHHLGAILTAKGIATLMTAEGKQALNVAQGTTVITVQDLDAKASFYIQQNGSPPTRLTPAKFVGHRRVTLMFTPGIWKYYASPRGAVHSFLVIG